MGNWLRITLTILNSRVIDIKKSLALKKEVFGGK